jgi:capsular exopolysaccharide synthesis family protein
MTSREVAERAVQRLNLLQNPEFTPQSSGFFSGDAAKDPKRTAAALTKAAVAVQGGIDVEPVRGTNLVELSFTGGDPELSADIANAVADAYIDWNLEAKYQVIGQASKFITAQIEQLKAEVSDKEKQLQAYGREKGIVSIDPQQNGTMQNLESLNKDYAEAVADRVAKEARYHELQNARPETVADTLSNGLVSQLRGEQAKLERDYAEKLNLFKPEWPAMQQLKAQIDKGRQHLVSVVEETVEKARDSARNDYLTSLRREQNLQTVLQGQKSEALNLNTSAIEYNNLKVEVETKRALLDSLLKKEAETQMTSRLRGEKVSTTRVVDRALPPTFRFSPSYRRSATTGGFLGLLLGCGLAFFLEYLDRSLRTTTQVEQILKLPALGVIPAVGRSRLGYAYYGSRRRRRAAEDSAEQQVAIELLPHEQQRSTVAEAYRAFRAALLLSRAGGLRSIVVTSSVPAEGKSTTAVNLAVVLGQLQKRVLLIDADLHKPRLHEVLRVSNRTGLVSVLAENASPASAIIETALPGVFLMPAGPISPNPSGLLSSDGMRELLKFADQNFDFVVIDTPPVSPVADAILIGHECDGVVLCVHAGRTPREVVSRVRDKFRRSNVRLLGALLNNLDENESAYGYYFRYYGKDKEGGTYGYTHDVLPAKAASSRS